METAKSVQALETNLDGYHPSAHSECARAMAEAVLQELSINPPFTRQSSPRGQGSVDEHASEQSAVSTHSCELRIALPSVDRIRLDPDLDFVIHDDGMIELTEAGFRRMVQAHSAGLDAVIGVDGREALRLPAPKLGHVPGSRQAI